VNNGTKAAMDAMAQHPGFNAFYNVDCGGDPYGIFSMIHTEGLHAIEVRLVKYMIEILIEELSEAAQVKLDKLVKRLLKHPRQHGYDAFPRLLWPDGVTGLANLTGMGKLLSNTLAALTLEGSQFFHPICAEGKVHGEK
jgi:hypothetical protein